LAIELCKNVSTEDKQKCIDSLLSDEIKAQLEQMLKQPPKSNK
jgi:hypothetical protein